MSYTQDQMNSAWEFINQETPSEAQQLTMAAIDSSDGDSGFVTQMATDTYSSGLAAINETDVVKTYELSFGAVPTATQLNAWTAGLQNNTFAVTDMTNAFTGSDGFAAHYGLSGDQSPTETTGSALADAIIFNATGAHGTMAQDTAWGGQELAVTVAAWSVSDTARPHYDSFVETYNADAILNQIVGSPAYPSGDLFHLTA
jgi:hypothetical protein